jgi:hypothetical protein
MCFRHRQETDRGAPNRQIRKGSFNEKKYDVDVEPEMPLLWELREELNLTGTK